MKKFKPGDPVYAIGEECGLGLAFRAIVLNVPMDEAIGNKTVVLDTSVPNNPRIIKAKKCHPDSSLSREQAQEILAAYGYDGNEGGDEQTGEEKAAGEESVPDLLRPF